MLRTRTTSAILARAGLFQNLSKAPKAPSTFYLSSCWDNQQFRFSSNTSPQQEDEKSPVFYEAPMGGLITRLKIVSISSCAVSLVVLPLLIFIKNGDLPTAKQMGVGGVALLGATGSTLSLHFVFGPYALSMEEVPAPEGTDDAKNTAFLKATTRSVFGWKNEYVFDSLSAAEPYSGARPFANFMVNGETLLYAHPELLDEDMRRRLIYPNGLPEEIEAANMERNEGLPNKRKEDDDDFF